MRTWRTEFDAGYVIPQRVLELVETGAIRDESWHNDAAPSFTMGRGVRLWIDAPDKANRELPWERFAVEVNGAIELKTDDESEFIRWVERELTTAPVVKRMRDEITNDMKSGEVPEDVKNYSELHDYVDANYYGGAFEAPDISSEEQIAFWNRAQGIVDRWLRLRATRTQCSDIGAAVEDENYMGAQGFLYCGCLFIVDTSITPNYPPRGRWYMQVDRSEDQSDCLHDLEQTLADWAEVNGYKF